MSISILRFAFELAEKINQRVISREIMDIDVMADEILEDCKETSIDILQEIVRQMNEDFRKDKQTRKELGLVIKEKDRPRSLMTALGMIRFDRDYFYDKENDRHICALDHMLGIAKYERVGAAVAAPTGITGSGDILRKSHPDSDRRCCEQTERP